MTAERDIKIHRLYKLKNSLNTIQTNVIQLTFMLRI